MNVRLVVEHSNSKSHSVDMCKLVYTNNLQEFPNFSGKLRFMSSGAARFERSENRASSSERSEDERSERSHCKTSIRFF